MRVERDEFYDNEPGPRKADMGQPGQEERVGDDADRKAPYTITVSDVLGYHHTAILKGTGVHSW